MNSIQPTISEGESLPLSISFADVDWVSGAPDSVTYRVDCITTGDEVTDWTSLTAAATVTLTISPEQNAIINDGNTRERKRALFKATDSDGQVRHESFVWWVKNEIGVS